MLWGMPQELHWRNPSGNALGMVQGKPWERPWGRNALNNVLGKASRNTLGNDSVNVLESASENALGKASRKVLGNTLGNVSENIGEHLIGCFGKCLKEILEKFFQESLKDCFKKCLRERLRG